MALTLREPPQPAAHRFNGVYAVLQTPFDDDETVDLESMGRLVEHVLGMGVSGVVCHGLGSEGPSLSEREQDEILRAVADQVARRAEVIVGVQPQSAAIAVERAVAAARAGADALMITPAPGDPVEQYRRVGAAVELPIVVQDAGWLGVELSLELLGRIAEAAPSARYVKLEVPPMGPKLTAVDAQGLEAIGGLGGLHLLEELDRGATATMPACAYASVFVAVTRAWLEGRHEEARGLFARILPLTAFASQGDLALGLNKWLLWRQGVISSPRVRHPAVMPDPRQLRWAERLAEEGRLDELLPESGSAGT